MSIARTTSVTPEAVSPLTGGKLLLAALFIGLGNFLVVLDTTIDTKGK